MIRQPGILLKTFVGVLALGVSAGIWANVAQAGLLSVGGDTFQAQLIAESMKENGLQFFAGDPQGMEIEGIVISSNDIVSGSDPWPAFVNLFHWRTKEIVIERELLFKKGDPWDILTISETERNLRANLVLAAAQIVPCQGSAPNKLIALVVTKDLWSFRPGLKFSIVGTQIQLLELQLTEQNLGGYRVIGGIDLGLDISTWWIGQQFRDPRLFGSRISFREKADIIFNRNSNALEGAVIDAAVEQPLYSLGSKWSYGVYLNMRNDVFRFFRNGVIAVLPSSTGEQVPFQYSRQLVDLRAQVTHSWGTEQKLDLSWGWRGVSKRFGNFYDFGTSPSLQAVQDFNNNYLPYSETIGMLFAQLHWYQPVFKKLIDIERFSITEDYQVGPDMSVEFREASPWFGFSSQFFEPIVTTGWNFYFPGEDLFSVQGSFDVRYQPQLGLNSPWADQVASLRIRNVSPRFSIFRLFTSVRFTQRSNDQDHEFDTLGGESALRGYAANYLFGPQTWGGNVELRSVPFSIKTVALGGALFFDMGDSFPNPITAATSHQALGLGVRFSVPQFLKSVIRLDVGFPIENWAIMNPGPAFFAASFGQAFY